MEKLVTGNKSSPTNSKRINLFLGETNSGKSSTLEVLVVLRRAGMPLLDQLITIEAGKTC